MTRPSPTLPTRGRVERENNRLTSASFFEASKTDAEVRRLFVAVDDRPLPHPPHALTRGEGERLTAASFEASKTEAEVRRLFVAVDDRPLPHPPHALTRGEGERLTSASFEA